jgi:alcohol dehydrogenase (cytochrome c)
MRLIYLLAGALLLTHAPARAQTHEDLLNDGRNTENVLTYGMGYYQQRYSTLNQINKRTVKRLVPVWNLSLNNDLGEQAQPIVHDGVMYVPNVKRTVAIDIATGRQLWQAVADWDPGVPRVICCGLSSRGVAVFGGKVFVGTIDAHLKALDAKTGKEIWKIKVAEWREGYSITSAPTVANGVVMQGIAGGEYGIRGFVDGYDPDTGKRLYRRHTTPDPGEKGSETWPNGDAYQRGAGSTWMTGSYDPQLDLVYWGVGNGGPWDPRARAPGDNLWMGSVIAMRPRTGEIVWHYQWTPSEPFDYDGINENVLADISIDGQVRKVLLHADRNGFLYVLDRANGRLLAANAFVKQNWAERIDMNTGRPVFSDVAKRLIAGEKVELWPRTTGGKNWPPMAFNPRTGLLYFTRLDEGMMLWYNPKLLDYKPGQRYTGAETVRVPLKPGEPFGYYNAMDPLTGKPKWQIPLHDADIGMWAGTLSTAGGLLFTGKQTGEFLAMDEDNGKVLWRFPTGSAVNAQPITYTHKGRQYVTVLSGIAGGTSVNLRAGNIPRGGSVWTFALMRD